MVNSFEKFISSLVDFKILMLTMKKKQNIPQNRLCIKKSKLVRNMSKAFARCFAA